MPKVHVPIPEWRGSVFPRGRKLWLKVKGPGGWKQVPTSFHRGEEKQAAALLARVRDRLLAGEAIDGILGPVTVRRWSKRWLETRVPAFGDQRPLDLLLGGRIERVTAALQALNSGMTT